MVVGLLVLGLAMAVCFSVSWLDYTITAAEIVADTSGVIETHPAGEAATAGLWVYKAADGKLYKCACTDSGKDECYGMLLADANAADVMVPVQRTGSPTVGSTVAIPVGGVCVLSAAGKIAPVADLAAADYTTYIGVGETGNKLQLHIHNSGQLVP